MYKFLDCKFNSESLIDLFNKSNKSHVKTLYQVTDDLIGNECIDEIFRQYPFILHHRFNVELGELSSYISPYISPGNNGLIVIPLTGSVTMSFFDYPSTRESLSPYRTVSTDELSAIRETLIEAVIIDRPFIFNGLVPHDYKPTDGSSLIAIFKIPLDVSWESIVDSI